MRLKKYMVNEMSMPSWVRRAFDKIKNELKGLSFSQLEKKCEGAYNTVSAIIDPKDLATFLRGVGVNPKILESKSINEDAKHWWDLIKTEAFPTLAFYPALQVWLELDKILKGTEYSGKVIAFYAAFWLVLVSGKYVAGWMNWKKTNKSEYEAEKVAGGGGLL